MLRRQACGGLHPWPAATSGAAGSPAPTVAAGAFPLSDYQPLPIEVLEDKLRVEPFTILEAKSSGAFL
jgi:hypothetical protein